MKPDSEPEQVSWFPRSTLCLKAEARPANTIYIKRQADEELSRDEGFRLKHKIM